MVANIIFFIIIISGSVLATTLKRGRSEAYIPITNMFLVTILFLFGVVHHLVTGVFFVLFLVLFVYIISIVIIVKNKEYLLFIKSFFTPAMIIFFLLYIIFNCCYIGMVAHAWDEFSHWMDCVKAMVNIDDFVANPVSNSSFKSYPPMMALFQYFFEKINFLVHPNTLFSEWRTYMAYSIFCVSFLFPFLDKLDKKKPVRNLLTFGSFLFIPLMFYSNYLTVLYIDCVVGVLAGCGFAMVLFHDDEANAIWEFVYISMLCEMLTLSKDVGLYFAIFIAMSYAVKNRQKLFYAFLKHNKSIKEPKGIYVLCPFFCVFLAKSIWNYIIRYFNVTKNFGGEIDFAYYTKIFFFNHDDTYRQTVVDNFKSAFYETRVTIGHTSIAISYCTILIISILCICILCHFLSLDATLQVKHTNWIICGILIMQAFFYIYGLGATYVSNFSEYEAVTLASYDRYIGMCYVPIWIVLVIGLYQYLERKKYMTLTIFTLFVVICLFCPIKNMIQLLERSTVRSSQQFRTSYNDLSDKIQANCSGSDKICFISQENGGFDYWVTRFNARTNILGLVAGFGSWSIGEEPFYEGDIYTTNISVENFKKALENFDYLAVYKYNDYFVEHYGVLFENSSQIANNGLYKINKETKLLELCE